MFWLLPFMCLDCSSLIPLLWIVALPFYAAFCGPDSVLRLSILMGVHSSVSSLLPAVLVSTIPLLQVGLMCVLLSLPVNLSPYPVVWMYDKLIWLSEPVLLTIEAIQVVRFIMYQSSKLIERIEEEPSFIKSFILGVAAACYAFSVSLTLTIKSSSSYTVPTWLIVMVWLIAMSILIAGIISEIGNILDVSVITLVMFVILWAMQQEVIISKQPISTPDTWFSESLDRRSFLHLFYSMIIASIVHVNNVSQAFLFLYNLISPPFLLLVGIRITTILHAVSLIPRGCEQNDRESTVIDDDLTTPTSSLFNWKSPLLIKLTLIFVYTQLVVYNIESYSSVDALGKGIVSNMSENITMSRVWQVLAVVSTYSYRLFYEEEFNSSEF